MSAPRVKLCAIAKNEGPYIADWLFHHLYFGFDAIEVWVNGTDDATGRIVANIAAAYPQVSKRNADRLLRTCIEEKRHFQQTAYNLQARQAAREGFTHVAFLDIDEYWTPLDFRSSITSFLPDDEDITVVSFSWCLDVPDQERRPFEAPFSGSLQMQVQHHVKSVARLDGSIRRALVHTFVTRRGSRLLAREPFPDHDPAAQKHGSMVTSRYLSEHWHRLPEAFVYHAINRSEREYLATLAQGYRQSGRELEFKPNRKGYVPTQAPVLTFAPPRLAMRRYRRRRASFHGELTLETMIRRSRRKASRRADLLVQRIRSDPAAGATLRDALRGTALEVGRPVEG